MHGILIDSVIYYVSCSRKFLTLSIDLGALMFYRHRVIALLREIYIFLSLEIKIHAFEPPCVILSMLTSIPNLYIFNYY